MSAGPVGPFDLRHHGDSELAPGLVDLAVNVRAGTPPRWLLERLHAVNLAGYPDATAATAATAARHHRDPSEVLLTAGAAEAFVLLARVLRPRHAVVVHPQFTEPEAALRAAGHPVSRCVLAPPFELEADLIDPDADLVMIGNPTNPTSVLHPAELIAGLARPGRVLVVDEAFADCVPGEPESLAARADLPGLVVVRSLTKTWGLAGLRAGYLLAEPALVARLREAQPLWSASSPALAAALACTEPGARAEVDRWARELNGQRSRLARELAAIDGVHVVPGARASFLLVQAPQHPELRAALRAAGYAVRRGDTFPGLDGTWFRVAVRDEHTSSAFAGAVRKALQMTAHDSAHTLLEETVAAIGPLHAAAVTEALRRQDALTKPRGSLGVLEAVSVQLAGLAGDCPAPLPERAAIAVFAADHGVHAQGVTPWPQEVTEQMVGNFLAGGAVINAIAAEVGARVVVVDIGVAATLPAELAGHPSLIARKVRAGTADLSIEASMTRDEAVTAIATGIEVARSLVADGAQVLITGDMGIANTTASAALIATFTGHEPAAVTGRGTGIDEAMLAVKIEVIGRALALHHPSAADPIGALAAVGGLEHAALAGFILGAAALRVPVILDGVIATAAALAAQAIAGDSLAAMIAGHRSAEPGASIALAQLGLRPRVDLDLRLGEGSGGALALPLVRSAARILRDVASFDSAGVVDKDQQQ
jgi:nicotinate-nucleotide--dimethylbenzimidazole phosphoribosyltransferase